MSCLGARLERTRRGNHQAPEVKETQSLKVKTVVISGTLTVKGFPKTLRVSPAMARVEQIQTSEARS